MNRKSRPRARLLKLSCLALPIVLAGCSNAEKAPLAVTVVDNSCKAYGTITWSVDDTPETSTAVRRHNRTYAELCPKAPSR